MFFRKGFWRKFLYINIIAEITNLLIHVKQVTTTKFSKDQLTCVDSEGAGQFVNIGILSNTAPDPINIPKLPSKNSMLGQHRRASETPLKLNWRFNGGPMMARL